MNNDISVILNVYKRPESLEKQIEAVLNQSVKIDPKNIHVWYNRSDKQQFLPKNSDINTYVCNWNTKFFGRFTLPLLCRTKYIAMFDDDILPQKDWFLNCLNTMNSHEGILGGSGVLVAGKTYNPHVKVGWNGTRTNVPVQVDLVGHAWFFKQEWTKHLWNEPPVSWDNGEDIMFAYVCQKNGINSFVPPHPVDKLNLWSTEDRFARTVGSDANASWLLKSHNTQRDDIVSELVKRGWKTINLK